MEYEKMVLLIRAVDDLQKLNDALLNLNRMGYQENFPQLDNIYEVIKSVFHKNTSNSPYAPVNETDKEKEVLSSDNTSS